MGTRGILARSARGAALAAALAMVAAACAESGTDTEAPDAAVGGDLVAHVASYDLAVGSQRFIVGLLTADNRPVSGGSAELRFLFLGGDTDEERMSATAEFLPLPGNEPEHEHPETDPKPRGVHRVEEVEFDLAGPWQVEVTAEVEGETRTGGAVFQVAEEHAVPAVGEEAPPTENLTMDDLGDAPIGAIDSRGETEGEIPDPHLHERTVAESIRDGHPLVVVFSTPVFCVSQFCGPITEMIDELREEYDDRADFIHVEVWRDFQGQVINKAAADWLLHDGNLQEPWVFFVDADGVIRGRWDNVATRPEIEPFLRGLPRLR